MNLLDANELQPAKVRERENHGPFALELIGFIRKYILKCNVLLCE